MVSDRERERRKSTPPLPIFGRVFQVTCSDRKIEPRKVGSIFKVSNHLANWFHFVVTTVIDIVPVLTPARPPLPVIKKRQLFDRLSRPLQGRCESPLSLYSTREVSFKLLPFPCERNRCWSRSPTPQQARPAWHRPRPPRVSHPSVQSWRS